MDKNRTFRKIGVDFIEEIISVEPRRVSASQTRTAGSKSLRPYAGGLNCVKRVACPHESGLSLDLNHEVSDFVDNAVEVLKLSCLSIRLAGR